MRESRGHAQATSREAPARVSHADCESIRAAIEHALHYLPTQGPISVFVHHNTLHPFEHLTFDAAVVEGGSLYGCEPYLSEERYRDELLRGRIRIEHLREILMADLGKSAEEVVCGFGSRYSLRLAMLQIELHSASEPELRWLLAESDLLNRFHSQVSPHRREQAIEQTRRYVSDDVAHHSNFHERSARPVLTRDLISSLIDELGGNVEAWSRSKWEAFALQLLWRVCDRGVQSTGAHGAPVKAPLRYRDLIFGTVGVDSDALVHEVLIRFCGVFLDQGLSDWPLPWRERGFAVAFAKMYMQRFTIAPAWMHGVQAELQQIVEGAFDPLRSIAHSLDLLGISAKDCDRYVLESMLALRGWAGMLWQSESSVPWLRSPAPRGSIDEYLAIRLILERYAIAYLGRQWFGSPAPARIRELAMRKSPYKQAAWTGQLTYTIFQLAQVCGLTPPQLHELSEQQWRSLVTEVVAFPSIERRRILHLGYERRFRNAALSALSIHSRRRHDALKQATSVVPAFHATFCLDDREESMRRHLEEVDPECETSSAAGFFAVAMYYRGADQAHYRPLCPNIITPKHYVTEQPLFSVIGAGQKRAQRRRRLGQLTHQVHSGSRTLIGGWLTGIFGAVATVPLVARILAPKLTAKIRKSFGSFVSSPPTELHLERSTPEPGSGPEAQGYSLDEMAAIVLRILQDIGLVNDMPPIVLMVGHGSSSLNNPHESAYSCGACSGGRGGPNARAFAMMANDPRVRQRVSQRGLVIPDEVRFLGAYHNTCTDGVEYFDLDLLPRSHRDLFRRIESSMNEARARNAHERSRRFELAPVDMTPKEALRHVEERAEDLSQARPEYNHATNAMAVVGRRSWTRGLFMDRRTFVTSYDYRIDDEKDSILTRILQAAIPVCAGISLEYYFSTVDPEGYGCGSKLPHNVASMLGVMTGAASDLRPGLSQQMVEIHEPMRILFVVETTPEKMQAIIEANPVIAALVEGEWVQLAVIDAENSAVRLYHDGSFQLVTLESNDLPWVESSIDWYRGQPNHLEFASVVERALVDALKDRGTAVLMQRDDS